MKVTGSQLVIGGILLYLLLRKRNKPTQLPPAPVKPATLPQQGYTAAPKTKAQQAPATGLAGDWELNCYHQVI